VNAVLLTAMQLKIVHAQEKRVFVGEDLVGLELGMYYGRGRVKG
jgi:hypothetical protein